MSGRELDQHALAVGKTDPDEQARVERKAAIHLADHVAAEHPHPLDERMPRIAGAVIAKDPAVRHDLGELLDALGLLKGDVHA